MEFVIGLAVLALTVIPLFKLLPAFGINALWSLAAIIPFGLVVLLWIMASRLDELEKA